MSVLPQKEDKKYRTLVLDCPSYLLLLTLGMLRSCYSLEKHSRYPLLVIMYEVDPTLNTGFEDKNSALEKLFFKIPGCGDVNVQDVDKWLITDDPEFNRIMTELFNLCFMASSIHHL